MFEGSNIFQNFRISKNWEQEIQRSLRELNPFAM